MPLLTTELLYHWCMKKQRKLVGWGWEGVIASPDVLVRVQQALGKQKHGLVDFPSLDEIQIRKPRFSVTTDLDAICTSDKYVQSLHCL